MGYYCTKCKQTHYSGEKFNKHKSFKGTKPKTTKKSSTSRTKTSSRQMPVMKKYKILRDHLEERDKYLGKALKGIRPKTLTDRINKVVEAAVNKIQNFSNNNIDIDINSDIIEIKKRLDKLSLDIEGLKNDRTVQ